MIKRSSILVGIVLVLGCAGSSRVEQALTRVDKENTKLKVDNDELRRKVEDFSNTILVLQDRLETLKLAVERRSGERVSKFDPGSGRRAATKMPKSKMPAVKVDDFKDEPFLIENDPRESSLPAIQLSNRDLERAERKGETPQEGSVAAEEPKPAENPEANKDYNDAFVFFEGQKYPEAISALEAFVKKYPTHPYADNAVFWIGESHLRTNDLLGAITQFERVARDYPTGKKVPNALLRAGDCYLRLQKVDDAKGVFTKVIQTFPKSVAAERAREWMARNSGGNQKGRM